jgi:preprotein translocase subunit Sec61beta
MTRPALLKLVMFQIVWLACAIGAAQGWSWPGIVTAAALVAWHLTSAPHWRPAAMTVLAAGTLGLIAESLLVAAGLLRYSAAYPTESLAPAWIVALWLAFSTTLETTHRLLGSHPFAKSACLGLCLGPLSYLAGERLGAVAVSQAQWPSYLAIAIIWGIAYPCLLALEGPLTEGHLGSHKCRLSG